MFHRRKLFYTSRSIELDEVKGCLAWQRPARVLNRTARRKLTLRAPSPCAGADAEGRPFEVRWSARPTFFIWPHMIVGTIARDCREV